MTISTLKIFTNQKSPLLNYTIDFIFNIIGVKYEFSDTFYDIAYIDDINTANARLCIIYQEKLQTPKELNNYFHTINNKHIISLDIFTIISNFLTDKCNDNFISKTDPHDRMLFEESYQYIHQIYETPIVNLYINFFKKSLIKLFKINTLPLWPDNKKSAVGLSHDVDNPDKPFWLKKREKYEKNYTSPTLIPNDYWLFKDIMNSETKYNFKSTFFFCSKNRFSEYANDNDVWYDIKQKNFLDIFFKIQDNNFEIGLHATYNSYKDLNFIKEEKLALEKIIKTEVLGLRHHFWHLGKDIENTLLLHNLSGFKYDSSIAFNYNLGFRRNTALPFYPFISHKNAAIDTMQLPVFCMDGNLCYQDFKIDEATQMFIKYFKSVYNLNGLGIIDWHVRTSYPKNKEYYEWGQTYQNILNELYLKKDVWVTSLKEIYRHLKNRDYQLKK